MRQEAACAKGEAAAVVLEDMESFYETINRDHLLAEAQALDFPMHLLRASLAAYAAPRVLTLNGIAAKELHPRRGLIAGCTFATTLVKVFYLRRMEAVVKKLPIGTNVDMYIDDVAVLAEGPKDRVAADAIRAHGLVKQAITEGLGCKLAPQKAAVIASHKAVGQRIARALNLGDGLVSAAPNLGTDATAGKARRVLRRGAKRWQRYRIGALRKKRLWAVARAVGRKAITIFTAGISPGITYGDEIWGGRRQRGRQASQNRGGGLAPPLAMQIAHDDSCLAWHAHRQGGDQGCRAVLQSHLAGCYEARPCHGAGG
jgi:hypothetical protein